MLRRRGLQLVEHEEELELERLLAPERAVVVEDGDAIAGRDIVVASRVGNRLDESHGRRLCLAVVPRRKRLCRRGDMKTKTKRTCFASCSCIPDEVYAADLHALTAAMLETGRIAELNSTRPEMQSLYCLPSDECAVARSPYDAIPIGLRYGQTGCTSRIGRRACRNTNRGCR